MQVAGRPASIAGWIGTNHLLLWLHAQQCRRQLCVTPALCGHSLCLNTQQYKLSRETTNLRDDLTTNIARSAMPYPLSLLKLSGNTSLNLTMAKLLIYGFLNDLAVIPGPIMNPDGPAWKTGRNFLCSFIA